MHRLITTLVMLLASVTGYSSNINIFDLESKIEDIVVDIVEPHIPKNKYVVIVTIDEESLDASPGDEVKLPFSSLKIKSKSLQQALDFNSPNKIFEVKFDIELLIDETLYEDKEKFLNDKITQALKIDGETRNLKLTSAKLVEEIIPEDPNESLKIEMERAKLEALQKEEELKKQLEEKENEAKKIAEGKKKTIIEYLQDFQLVILSIIIVLGLLIVTILGSGSFKKGATSISDALKAVGESLAAQKDGGGDAGGGDEAEAEAAPESGASGEELAVGASEADMEKREAFLGLVEEKIEVLSKEGNYNFFRNFMDMVETNLPFASAILVSVKEESAKKLISFLPTESVDKISEFLAEPSALSEAKKARASALESFYGSIAMDEFTDSPLANKTGIDWLIKLSNVDLLELVLGLEKEDRVVFLACFTPTRISAILEKTDDESKKDQIMSSVIEVDSVTFESVDAVFEKVSGVYEKQKKAEEELVRKLVDGPRYIANIITTVGEANREKLMEKVSEKTELLEGIKKYYIPFETISKIEDRIVSDIFSRRPTQQVALAMFATSDDVRTAISNSMPEMIRDTLQEELDSLLDDKGSEKPNKAKSLKIQGEVCRYLLKLNKDGLLEYKEESAA